ncbi:ensconsin [Anaeramoeba flamelloides]|uniref:Ensconsin n=1 Tax=Anaeramoeba flamelloides TaxID=1746091 RepID=A0ABQ8YR82_9EUKA|nr:ensconsin [Anaeramoeba flamelloides]
MDLSFLSFDEFTSFSTIENEEALLSSDQIVNDLLSEELGITTQDLIFKKQSTQNENNNDNYNYNENVFFEGTNRKRSYQETKSQKKKNNKEQKQENEKEQSIFTKNQISSFEKKTSQEKIKSIIEIKCENNQCENNKKEKENNKKEKENKKERENEKEREDLQTKKKNHKLILRVRKKKIDDKKSKNSKYKRRYVLISKSNNAEHNEQDRKKDKLKDFTRTKTMLTDKAIEKRQELLKISTVHDIRELTEQEKRLRRLEKNRVSARRTREKKQQYYLQLENNNKQLKEKNESFERILQKKELEIKNLNETIKQQKLFFQQQLLKIHSNNTNSICSNFQQNKNVGINNNNNYNNNYNNNNNNNNNNNSSNNQIITNKNISIIDKINIVEDKTNQELNLHLEDVLLVEPESMPLDEKDFELSTEKGNKKNNSEYNLQNKYKAPIYGTTLLAILVLLGLFFYNGWVFPKKQQNSVDFISNKGSDNNKMLTKNGMQNEDVITKQGKSNIMDRIPFLSGNGNGDGNDFEYKIEKEQKNKFGNEKEKEMEIEKKMKENEKNNENYQAEMDIEKEMKEFENEIDSINEIPRYKETETEKIKQFKEINIDDGEIVSNKHIIINR